MRQERRIFFEALIVAALGHVIFFSVFTVKETEAGQGPRRAPEVLTIAPFHGVDVIGSRATPNPALTDADLLAHVELERRTTAPKLDLDRATYVWEDEPQLAAPAPPTVGPATWGFAKEPAQLGDEFPADYAAAPSLAAVRDALRGGSSDNEGTQPMIQLTLLMTKIRGAGTLMLGPEAAEGNDRELGQIRIRMDRSTGKVEVLSKPTGNPEIDAALAKKVRKWQLDVSPASKGYQLYSPLHVPVAMRMGGPGRKPPSADEVLDEEPGRSGGAP